MKTKKIIVAISIDGREKMWDWNGTLDDKKQIVREIRQHQTSISWPVLIIILVLFVLGIIWSIIDITTSSWLF